MLASKLSLNAKSNVSSPLSDATNSASSNENKKRKHNDDPDDKKDVTGKPNKRRQIEKAVCNEARDLRLYRLANPALHMQTKNNVSETKSATQKPAASTVRKTALFNKPVC
jgi:hypothetical protein